MPTKKRSEKQARMFSLQFYLQTKAAEKADKLVLREEKRKAKLEAQNKKKKHVHNEECGEGCNHEH
jgi:hypothetical protein